MNLRLLGLLYIYLKVMWTAFLWIEGFLKVNTPADITFRSPFTIAFVLTFAWYLWRSPAGVFRRAILIVILILEGWLNVGKFIELPMAYLGYGYLLSCYALISRVVNLRGWDNDGHLSPVHQVRRNFSIWDLFAATTVAATLCLAAQTVPSMISLVEFGIVTAAYAAIGVFVQHGFTADSKNNWWMYAAIGTSLLCIALQSFIVMFESDFASWFQSSYFGVGGILNSRYWIEGAYYVTKFLIFISIFSAPAAWLRIKQDCDTATKARLIGK